MSDARRALRCLGDRLLVGVILGVAVISLTAAGCGPSGSEPQPAVPVTQSHSAALVGKDGDFKVNATDTVLNQYAVLSNDFPAGATSVEVSDIDSLTSTDFGPIEEGDLVMIIQMQGAEINTSNSATYGEVTDLRSAGRYEIISVAGVNGKTLDLGTSCGGLKYAYSAEGGTQVVRIPQLTSLTVEAGTSVVAPPWDGQRGGVVAIHTLGSAVLDGPIDVSGLGFRGGEIDNQSQPAANDVPGYRASNAAAGAEKGESIAGDSVTYAVLNGKFGRGAPANGGGGGNSHNGGGGGGANGNNGKAWMGLGVMDPNPAYMMAWALDPLYGGMLADSAGGGRAGYSQSTTNQDALVLGPGQALWGGNSRRERGGLGGRPVENDTAGRLFFGGGGGAGDGNNGGAGGGGRGGGIAVLIADSVSGSSGILANGAAGLSTTGTHNDAPGGGGGGGTVVVRAPKGLSGISVQADGGAGGNQLIQVAEAEGPGGGGGGGFIALFGGSATISALGGANGTTTSTALTEFPPNGATSGAEGKPDASAETLSICLDLDSDSDGLTDDQEAGIGSDPNDADSDDDGLGDGQELSQSVDTDGDGLVNAVDPDSDNDGLSDGMEVGLGCDGPGTDAEADRCIPDADKGATVTDPLDPDTDAGGVSDGAEDTNQNGIVDPKETDPTKGHEGDDDTNADTDNDGLSNAIEVQIGTDPDDADSDDDGVGDGQEPNPAIDMDSDGLIDALDSDSDNDGLFDGTELGLDCDNPATNNEKKRCTPDGDQGATTTSPLDPDSDDGGVSDGSEDANLNGVVNGMETDPTVGNGADDSSNVDSDGDGLSDGLEGFIGTNPNDADSDDDGVVDGQEPNPASDIDGDGLIDVLDSDSDGDGLFDGTEIGFGCDEPATTNEAKHCIPDDDAGATTTSPLDPDTDNGGVRDGDEDTNHNGVVDTGERDPNNGADDIETPPTGCQADSECGAANSGKVCDTSTGLCVEGCKDVSGAGCPVGLFCILPEDGTEIGHCGDQSSGVGGIGASGDDYIEYDGCICGVPSGAPARDLSWTLLATAAALAARRRRRAP